MTPDAVRDLLSRLNTAALQQGDQKTVALIVVNPREAPVARGLAVLRACFSIRAEVGARPVIVCDAVGQFVPSRIAHQALETDSALPPGRVWWSLELQFLANDIPAHGWRAYAATYGDDVPSDRASTVGDAIPIAPLLAVYETDCHTGHLPLVGSLATPTTDASGKRGKQPPINAPGSRR